MTLGTGDLVAGSDTESSRDASRRVAMRLPDAQQRMKIARSGGFGALPNSVEMSLDAADTSVCATIFEGISTRQK